jgi:hypothetical protein
MEKPHGTGQAVPLSGVYMTAGYTSFKNLLHGNKDYNVFVNGQGKDKLPSCN